MLKKTSQKIFSIWFLLILTLSFIFIINIEISQGIEEQAADSGFALLENYGDEFDDIKDAINEGNSNEALSAYINFIVKFSSGLLSIGAVIMIIYAGIVYIGSETWLKKSDSKTYNYACSWCDSASLIFIYFFQST